MVLRRLNKILTEMFHLLQFHPPWCSHAIQTLPPCIWYYVLQHMQSIRPKAGRFRRIFHSLVCSRFTSRLARRIGFLDLTDQAAEHDKLSSTGSVLVRPEPFPSEMQCVVTDFCPLRCDRTRGCRILFERAACDFSLNSRWLCWMNVQRTQHVFHVSRHLTSLRAGGGKSRNTNARVQQNLSWLLFRTVCIFSCASITFLAINLCNRWYL